MNQGYRDDLAAAQARIAELEGEIARGHEAPALDALEREHAALVRTVPGRDRLGLMIGFAALVAVTSLVTMLFLSSPTDGHPRFSVAMEVLTMCSSAFVALSTWVARAEGLKKVALSERLLAAERARAALEARVRVASSSTTRVADLEEAEAVESTRARAAK